MVALTMPLSRTQLSPLSVRETGSLTVTLATLGSTLAARCAAAPHVITTARARNVGTKTTFALVMAQPFRMNLEVETHPTCIESPLNRHELYSAMGIARLALQGWRVFGN